MPGRGSLHRTGFDDPNFGAFCSTVWHIGAEKDKRILWQEC